ncbi:MAG: hypothetical protein ACYDCI_05635 [Candidatus Limnocylindrales bacterium]
MTPAQLADLERLFPELILELTRLRERNAELEHARTRDCDHSPCIDDAAALRERNAALVAALGPWLRHKIWCNVKTDDPPDTERCKCGLVEALLAETPE